MLTMQASGLSSWSAAMPASRVATGPRTTPLWSSISETMSMARIASSSTTRMRRPARSTVVMESVLELLFDGVAAVTHRFHGMFHFGLRSTCFAGFVFDFVVLAAGNFGAVLLRVRHLSLLKWVAITANAAMNRRFNQELERNRPSRIESADVPR